MIAIEDKIISFLRAQGFVIVSSLDQEGRIHCSAKGVVGLEGVGKVYVIDLYCGATFRNLKANPTISLTAVDEQQFCGYTLQGKAKIIKGQEISQSVIDQWQKTLINRMSTRVIKNIKRDKSSEHQPETGFPQPEYLIEVTVEAIVDLAPAQLKGGN